VRYDIYIHIYMSLGGKGLISCIPMYLRLPENGDLALKYTAVFVFIDNVISYNLCSPCNLPSSRNAGDATSSPHISSSNQNIPSRL
jgi:hypothetical protein